MVANLPEVHIARREEEDEILAMCRKLHAENGIFSLNESKVRDTIRKCYEAKGTIVGVIGTPGHLEASTCLSVSDTHYTDDWHLVELWNHVLPEYRRTRNAEALIEFGKSCSDKMGVPLFTGIISSKQMVGKVRLYRRRLGYPVGAFFIYNSPMKCVEPECETHDDLRRRLMEFADKHSNRGISKDSAKENLLPLLKEAAAIIRKIEREDDFWPAVEITGTIGNGKAA